MRGGPCVCVSGGGLKNGRKPGYGGSGEGRSVDPTRVQWGCRFCILGLLHAGKQVLWDLLNTYLSSTSGVFEVSACLIFLVSYVLEITKLGLLLSGGKRSRRFGC